MANKNFNLPPTTSFLQSHGLSRREAIHAKTLIRAFPEVKDYQIAGQFNEAGYDAAMGLYRDSVKAALAKCKGSRVADVAKRDAKEKHGWKRTATGGLGFGAGGSERLKVVDGVA